MHSNRTARLTEEWPGNEVDIPLRRGFSAIQLIAASCERWSAAASKMHSCAFLASGAETNRISTQAQLGWGINSWEEQSSVFCLISLRMDRMIHMWHDCLACFCFV